MHNSTRYVPVGYCFVSILHDTREMGSDTGCAASFIVLTMSIFLRRSYRDSIQHVESLADRTRTL